MEATLRAEIERSGATLDPQSSRPLHFGDPAEELRAALEGCLVADRSDLGRLLATGPDLLGLLHRLSTNTVKDLAPSEGVATVLTSSKGRIVERLFVHHLGGDGVLLVAGPGGAERVTAHLARYTFAEDTGLSDAGASHCHIALIGPRAADLLRAAGLPGPEAGTSSPARLEDVDLHVLGEDGLSTSGFSLFAPAEHAARLWAAAAAAAARAGGRAGGDTALEAWRVLRGLGAGGHELNEDHNPLEAGLWNAVRFDKGCYVGQEVVARLNTYDKVARSVRGFVLGEGDDAPSPGTPLFAEGRRVGELTSAVTPPGRRRPVALGYVKRTFAAAGTELRLGEGDDAPTVRVRDVPFGDTD